MAAVAENTLANSPPEPSENCASASPLKLFQQFISPADGDRCPMSPTCSHYAQQALAQEGLLVGWILTCDRLLRCGRDEIRLAQPIRMDGAMHAHDPLDANTFWWKRR